jgi:hypothetical protein
MKTIVPIDIDITGGWDAMRRKMYEDYHNRQNASMALWLKRNAKNTQDIVDAEFEVIEHK